MKKTSLLTAILLLTVFCPLSLAAQDTLYFLSGEKTAVRVRAMKKHHVEYVLWGDTSRTLRENAKASLNRIRFMDGEHFLCQYDSAEAAAITRALTLEQLAEFGKAQGSEKKRNNTSFFNGSTDIMNTVRGIVGYSYTARMTGPMLEHPEYMKSYQKASKKRSGTKGLKTVGIIAGSIGIFVAMLAVAIASNPPNILGP